MRKPRETGPPTVPLGAVRANAGLRNAYQARLDALIDELYASLTYWLAAKYRANAPEMATDESPAMALRRAMRKLTRRWQRKFDDVAPELASYFAQAANDRSDVALQALLRKSGFTVRFKASVAQNDVYQAVVGENVGLIKSIAQKSLTDVEGAVMRSVAAGRSLGDLTKELQHQHGLTKKRAAFIARDQNNKATAVMVRVRQQELGVKQAIWKHSAGGKHPRPEHVAFDGQKYDVEKGAYLDGKWTWPGVEPNCRCYSVSVIPGFDA